MLSIGSTELSITCSLVNSRRPTMTPHETFLGAITCDGFTRITKRRSPEELLRLDFCISESDQIPRTDFPRLFFIQVATQLQFFHEVDADKLV